MHDKFTRYLLDSTGVNPDNLVKSEDHILTKNKIRAIVPTYGAFHNDSVIVYDKTSKRKLDYGTDYCSAGLLQNETMIHGKAISTVILILNPQVSSNVSITYQCLGGDYERNNIGLETLLKLDKPDNNNYHFNDIEKLPSVFKSSFHLHDFGDIYGMDYLVFLLEKLRLAIVWKKVELVITVIYYVDEYLNQLTSDVISLADDTFHSLLIKFKSQFNKITYGLGFLKNNSLITVDEAKAIFNDEYYDKVKEAYLSKKGIAALRDEMYSASVSMRYTNIGKPHGSYIPPTLTTLSSIMVGSVYILNSYTMNVLDKVSINDAIYPDSSKKETKWSLKKISGKVSEVGGIFLATAINDNSTYIGRLRVNSLNELFMEWKSLINNLDIDFLTELDDHLQDNTNPHNDHKSRLKLGNVENLPVATREEIVCNIPARAYITFDNLMLYMKRFQTGEKNVRDIDLEESELNTKRRMQAIFSPCGPCNTDKDEWNLVSECMVPAPPDKIPEAYYEADKSLVTSDNESATLTSYLYDFKPNREVIINVYRRVVEYEIPTTPPPTVTSAPPVVEYYYASWQDCPDGETQCSKITKTILIGDSNNIDLPEDYTIHGAVKTNLNEIVDSNVRWEMQDFELETSNTNVKNLLSKLVETNAVYQIDDHIIKIKPGVMDDFAIRGLYKNVETVTAMRKTVFTAFIDDTEVGTISLIKEFKIDVI